MADTPPPDGRDIEDLVELARRQLGVEVAFITRRVGGRDHVVVAAGGSSAVAARVHREGAYAALDIHHGDGRVHGRLCVSSDVPLEDLPADRRAVLDFVVGLVSYRLATIEAVRADEDAARGRVQEFLRRGGPRVVVQPVVDLNTGAIVGFEALSRFDGTTPDRVFEDARIAGLAVALEATAVRNATSVIERLRPDLSVGINVGADTLMSSTFDVMLEQLDPARVHLELTEHDVEHDRDRLTRRFAELRSAGFRLALDDVGAGYSGLERIIRLQPEIIKLDRAIVTGLVDDAARTAMVTATLGFADDVGAELIAEGIETTGEQHLLQDLGVRLGQGYGLGRPVPVEDLPAEVLV